MPCILRRKTLSKTENETMPLFVSEKKPQTKT